MADAGGAYVPIACAEHERLELAVLRRWKLRLRYASGTGEREEVVVPLDVATRDGAEWLSFRDSAGATRTLRLDRILGCQPASGSSPRSY